MTVTHTFYAEQNLTVAETSDWWVTTRPNWICGSPPRAGSHAPWASITSFLATTLPSSYSSSWLLCSSESPPGLVLRSKIRIAEFRTKSHSCFCRSSPPPAPLKLSKNKREKGLSSVASGSLKIWSQLESSVLCSWIAVVFQNCFYCLLSPHREFCPEHSVMRERWGLLRTV